jgi:hypothetical protein
MGIGEIIGDFISDTRVIYACDVGSTRRQRNGFPSFAWSRVNPQSSPLYFEAHYDIDCLIELIAADMKAGKSIALGLESPLFLPEPDASAHLFHCRGDEGRWAWCGRPGLAVTASGIHLSAWILRALHRVRSSDYLFTLDGRDWPPRGDRRLLFLWEAFVSGSAHWRKEGPDSHMHDAATAAHFFTLNEYTLSHLDEFKAETPINLAAAAALWSGWLPASDTEWLSKPTLILRPKEPCDLHLHTPTCGQAKLP